MLFAASSRYVLLITGRKDMISSYSSSFNCSRLISSLWTGQNERQAEGSEDEKEKNTCGQIRRILDLEEVRPARRRDRAAQSRYYGQGEYRGVNVHMPRGMDVPERLRL